MIVFLPHVSKKIHVFIIVISKIKSILKNYETFLITDIIPEMNFAILRFLENKGSAYFMKILKTSYHNNSPPITAPANKGQDLQVPLGPLSWGYTVDLDSNTLL